MDIEDYRNKIDEIDGELVKLFEKRMNVAMNIAKYKKQNNLEIINSSRESEVIEKNIQRLQNKDLSLFTEKFFVNLMKLSRSYQKKLIKNEDYKATNDDIDIKNSKIGYQGVKGSFSEEAMIKYFGKDCTSISYDEFEDVFKALDKREIDYGILPIENSFTGYISEVYDLLIKYGFYIVGEECIKIEQNLIGIKGSTIDDIKEVYSHLQGFEQSKDFFYKHNNLKKITYQNTAISAKHVAKLNDKTRAAIASKRAAQIYDLDIIKKEINDKDDNNTKFIIIGRDLITSGQKDKITIVLSLDNKAGTLYNYIKYFAQNSINMVKIESRPTKDEPWEYHLYLDFEGDMKNKVIKDVLKLIEQKSEYFQLLGFYKKASN